MDVSHRPSVDGREPLVGRGQRIVSANRTDGQVGVEWGRPPQVVVCRVPLTCRSRRRADWAPTPLAGTICAAR